MFSDAAGQSCQELDNANKTAQSPDLNQDRSRMRDGKRKEKRAKL
jgi:hypothetical protein